MNGTNDDLSHGLLHGVHVRFLCVFTGDRPVMSKVRSIRKVCGLCGRIKQMVHFHKRAASKDGRQSFCIKCRRGDNYGKR